jgi:putative phosphoesterase
MGEVDPLEKPPMPDPHRTTSLHGIRQLGVVSDTHGNTISTQKAVRVLESMQVDAVLHCGDIGSAAIPPLFASWPTHFVFGNVDWNRNELQQAIEQAGLSTHGRFGAFQAGERRIALLHSDDEKRFRDTIQNGKWDLVCYGHTHLAEHHFVNKTLVLNPGAIDRTRRPSVAVVNISTLDVTSIPLE